MTIIATVIIMMFKVMLSFLYVAGIYKDGQAERYRWVLLDIIVPPVSVLRAALMFIKVIK